MLRTDHVALQVSDMDEAIRFYTKVLGLALISREVSEEEDEEFVFLELDGGNLELLRSLSAPLSQKPEIKAPYCPHLALATDDMDKTLDTLRELSVPIVKGPLEIPGRIKWLYVSDPDHNVIEFIQWL